MSKKIQAPLTQIPAYLQTIADYEKQAEQHLPENTWHYLQGGAMDEQSVQENLQQFKNIQLIPRLLNDLTQGSTECEILGSVHDKFHRTLILSGFCLLKIAKISLNSSFFPKPIKR